MVKLIGISGKIGSGKSTLCTLICKELIEMGYNAEIRNFADKLKQLTYDLTGFKTYTQEQKNVFMEDWGMTAGDALQLIGTNALRENFHKDVWVISTLTNLNPDTFYIIGDERFPNEVKKIKEKGGISIRLTGDPADIRKNSQRDLNHSSETALDDYKVFDIFYENTGSLDDLKSFAKRIVQDFVIG